MIYSVGFELNTLKFHWYEKVWWKIKSIFNKPNFKWYRLEIKGKALINIDGVPIKIEKNGFLHWMVMAETGSVEMIKNFLNPKKGKHYV